MELTRLASTSIEENLAGVAGTEVSSISWRAAHRQPLGRLSAHEQQRMAKIPKCVYCGERPGTTADHVVPKVFLVRPYPPNLITVKCCVTCQNDFQLAEERVRDIAVRGIPGWEERHPLVSSRARRSRLRTPGVYPSLRKPVLTEARLLAHVETVTIPQGIVDKVFFRKMTVGLHYHYRSETLREVAFRAGLLTALQFDALVRRLPHRRRYGKNDEVCWATGHLEDDATSSIWVSSLYNAIGVGVFTGKAVLYVPKKFAKGIIVGGNPDSY